MSDTVKTLTEQLDQELREKKRKAKLEREIEALKEWNSLDESVRKDNLNGLFRARTGFENAMMEIMADAQSMGARWVNHRKVRTHISGNRVEKYVRDPVTRKGIKIAEGRIDNTGRTVATEVFGKTPDEVTPQDVAKVFNITYRSPFEDRVPHPSQEAVDAVDADRIRDAEVKLAETHILKNLVKDDPSLLGVSEESVKEKFKLNGKGE